MFRDEILEVGGKKESFWFSFLGDGFLWLLSKQLTSALSEGVQGFCKHTANNECQDRRELCSPATRPNPAKLQTNHVYAQGLLEGWLGSHLQQFFGSFSIAFIPSISNRPVHALWAFIWLINLQTGVTVTHRPFGKVSHFFQTTRLRPDKLITSNTFLTGYLSIKSNI